MDIQKKQNTLYVHVINDNPSLKKITKRLNAREEFVEANVCFVNVTLDEYSEKLHKYPTETLFLFFSSSTHNLSEYVAKSCKSSPYKLLIPDYANVFIFILQPYSSLQILPPLPSKTSIEHLVNSLEKRLKYISYLLYDEESKELYDKTCTRQTYRRTCSHNQKTFEDIVSKLETFSIEGGVVANRDRTNEAGNSGKSFIASPPSSSRARSNELNKESTTTAVKKTNNIHVYQAYRHNNHLVGFFNRCQQFMHMQKRFYSVNPNDYKEKMKEHPSGILLFVFYSASNDPVEEFAEILQKQPLEPMVRSYSRLFVVAMRNTFDVSHVPHAVDVHNIHHDLPKYVTNILAGFSFLLFAKHDNEVYEADFTRDTNKAASVYNGDNLVFLSVVLDMD